MPYMAAMFYLESDGADGGALGGRQGLHADRACVDSVQHEDNLLSLWRIKWDHVQLIVTMFSD